MPNQPDSFRLLIPEDWTGRRLDKTLVHLAPELTRSRWQAMVRAGHVTLNGTPIVKPGHTLEGGEDLAWDLPEVPPSQDSQGQVVVDLPIVHLDDHICVVNKTAGILSHRNHATQALAVPELVAHQVGELPEGEEPLRPGVVHRLDRGTSGVMVLARTEEAMAKMMAAFAAREVEKTYMAVVLGVPRFDSEWIEDPIERDPHKPDRRRIAAEGEGKPSSTLLEVVERYGEVAALCHAKPTTGRTHQIRVHFASRGLPIVGDKLYRPRNSREDLLPDECKRMARPALHALSIAFEHPGTGKRVEYSAEVPSDLQAVLDALRG